MYPIAQQVNDILESNTAKQNRKALKEGLQKVATKLEKADRAGKEAELALKRAKQEGDKEAAKYLKFVPSDVSVAAVSSSATSSPMKTPVAPAVTVKK